MLNAEQATREEFLESGMSDTLAVSSPSLTFPPLKVAAARGTKKRGLSASGTLSPDHPVAALSPQHVLHPCRSSRLPPPTVVHLILVLKLAESCFVVRWGVVCHLHSSGRAVRSKWSREHGRAVRRVSACSAACGSVQCSRMAVEHQTTSTTPATVSMAKVKGTPPAVRC